MDSARRHTLGALAGSLLGAVAAPWRGHAQTPPPVPPARAITTLTAMRQSADPAAATRPPLAYGPAAAAPVLRLRKGDGLALRLVNALDKPTSLHWHGMRGPNALDGAVGLTGPALPPGETASIAFVPPDSGLFWFHPAAVPGAADQTAQGLHGVLLVEEAEPPVVDLDHVVVVADGVQPGLDHLLVNGAIEAGAPTVVPGARVRLRLLNASTSRLVIAAIEGAKSLLIAIDGQPCDLFRPVRDTVPIGPGARFEFMLDMPREAGATVRLLLRGTDSTAAGGREPDRTVLTLAAAGVARTPLPPIVALPRNPSLPPAIPLERSARATLAVEAVDRPGTTRWRVNGAAGIALSATPLLTVRRGQPVTLALDNHSPEPVGFRLHGHVMRLLHAKDDGWEPYWRDSVLVGPTSVQHVAFLADNPGKWLIESPLFAQSASGLRHWFAVES